MDNSKRKCISCGGAMKEQFIGLKHCKCGISWHKPIGYFERTPDMVFKLQKQRVGKKIKQVPIIDYKSKEEKIMTKDYVKENWCDKEDFIEYQESGCSG